MSILSSLRSLPRRAAQGVYRAACHLMDRVAHAYLTLTPLTPTEEKASLVLLGLVWLAVPLLNSLS